MTTSTRPVRVLMVCLGNICRSPTAEAALREAAGEAGLAVEVDSAGTAAYHVGGPPNPPMVAAAAAEGLTVTGTARQATVDDFKDFDLVIAMDQANLADLRGLSPGHAEQGRLRLFRDYAGAPGRDVPDPYGGPPSGFSEVVQIAREAAAGLVEAIMSGRETPA